MPKEIVYSSEEAYNSAVRSGNVKTPNEEDIADINQPLDGPATAAIKDEMTPDEKGQYVAEMMARYQAHGYVPTFDEAMALRAWRAKQEVSAWDSISGAMEHTASTLANGAWELTKDVATLKVPKVLGSVVEGAALGTKNWMYMYEQAKYDEDSWLHKMLYDSHSSDQEYYWNLKQSIETNKMIANDERDGIIVPHQINIGGMDIDLTNPAVVQAISYVADPSWLLPELGIEATIAKGMRGAAGILQLNEQLTKASVFSTKKASTLAGKIGEKAGALAGLVERTEEKLVESFKNLTGIDASIKGGGQAMYKDNLVRGAAEGVGANNLRIPAWGFTTLTWGAAKMTEVAAKTAELGFELASQESKIAGLKISERIAAESANPVVANLARTWSVTGSPMLEWGTATAKTSLHSAMYGGAFGLVMGGEDGFYNGLGTGFVLGGAFHQIGVAHGAVSGGNAVQDVVKNFLWATQHFEYHNQEGLARLLQIVERDGGTKAKLSTMAQVGAAERLQRNERRLYLTEKRIKKMALSPEWARYTELLNDPNFGGVSFHHTVNGENVTIINVDRAAKSALSEELLHTVLLNDRYAQPFKKAAVEALIGTEDSAGALYRMPKDEAVRLVEAFRDSYLKLEGSLKDTNPAAMEAIHQDFNHSIEQLKRGEKPTTLRTAYEEFLTSYWNRFIEEKPIDYLLNGGDLGLIRNSIEWGKDVYRDIMYKDLTSAGANFKWGTNPDNFFIEQNTKQRIRIPMLDKLMRHYVKEVGGDRYKGWKKNPVVHSDTGVAFASELEHLFNKEGGTKAEILSDEVLAGSQTKALFGIVDELSKAPSDKRGLTFAFHQGNSPTPEYTFSPAKPKKKKTVPKDKRITHFDKEETVAMPTSKSDDDHWATVRKKMKQVFNEEVDSTLEQADIKNLRGKKGEVQEVDVEDNVGYDKMEKDDEGFWKSNWQGNPRIKITGKATDYELKVLAKYLPENTVKRFAQLNTVIERSRQGMLGSISNTLQAPILTKSREKESGARERGFKTRHSTFIPVEINLYFQRKKVGEVNDAGIQKYKMGDAQLLVKAIDMDAFMTRVDHSWNKLDEKGVDYKMVRRLFGTKENLVEAAKALLSNYSNGEKAEAGAKMFQSNTTSIREAAHMRDIVNAVIGFHPTKEMLQGGMKMIDRSEGNYPLKFQRRNTDKKVSIPTVMTDFNISRIGTLRALDGEGFRYDHDNAYVRSQFNFSPAKGGRDHEGVFIPASAERILKNTVYRNKDGEVLAVYDLRKANAERYKITTEPSVYDFVDDGLGRMFDIAIPTLRGSQYSTQSGWNHYTPDGYEAGIVADKRLVTGYIDTQSHLDVSQIPHNADYKTAINTVAERVSQITSKNVEQVLNDILKLRDEEGTTFRELYSREPENILHTEGNSMDNWLFTRDNIDFFNNLGIHSVEYLALNELNGNEYSAVAVYDNKRFIENVSKQSMTEKFSFSPAKSVHEKFEKVLKQKGYSRAFLDYVVDKNGNVVPNTRKISEKDIHRIIEEEKVRIQRTVDNLKKLDLTPEEMHERGVQALLPFVKAKLREKFKFAPNAILDKVAEMSLRGYNLTSVGNAIMNGSLFLEQSYKYGINARTLLESGVPMLAHAAEMTEVEYKAMQMYPKWMEVMRGGKESELKFMKTEEGRNMFTLINEHIFAQHGGWSGFFDAIDKRHQSLLMLVDKQVMRNKVNDGIDYSPINYKKLKELFVEKTRTLVVESLRKDNLTGAQYLALNELNNYQRTQPVNPKGVISDTFFDRESEIAHARLQEFQHKIDNLWTQESSSRLDDILTAYNINGSDANVIEWVRAHLYDESSKGLLQLGTPDAIKRSVELYALYSEQTHGKVFDIQRTIVEQYVEALKGLEEKGYYGSNWAIQSHAGKLFEGKDNYVVGTHLWRLEGSDYTVIERLPNHKELSTAESMKWKYIEMYDNKGNIILSDRFLKEGSDSNVDKARKNFLRQATKRVNDSATKLGLFSGHYEVEGPKKDFILRSLLDEKGEKIPDNFDNWELRSKGDTYVAIQRIDEGTDVQSVLNKNGAWAGFKILPEMTLDNNGRSVDSGRTRFGPSGKTTTVKAEIETLKKILAEGAPITVRKEKKVKQIKNVKGGYGKGKPVYETVTKIVYEDTGKKRPLDLAETVHLREQLTKLQNIQYSDTGTIFQIDGKYNFVFPPDAQGINTIQKRTKALQELKSGQSPNVGFENYLEGLYKDFEQRIKARTRAEQKLIDTILSDGPNGNIAKIKALETEVRDGESKWKRYITKRTQELNVEQKRNKQPPLTALDTIKTIERDLDAAQKGTRYHGDKVLVLEHQLRHYNALERMELMSLAEKDAWMTEYSYLKEDGKADQHLMAQDPTESKLAFVQRIRAQIAQSKQKQVEFRRTYDEIRGLIDGNSQIKERAEYQIEFLAKQYAAAKGHKLSDKFVREITEQEYLDGTESSKLGVGNTNFNVQSLKKLGLHPKTKPSYMPDEFGVLGDGSKTFVSKEQYKKAFEEGITYIRDRWHTATNKDSLALQGVLDMGFEHINADVNTEKKYSKEIDRLKKLGKFSEAKVITWMQQPENQAFVESVMQKFKDNYYDKDEAVRAIEEKYDLETLGTYGRILKGSEARLRETNRSLAEHFTELDSLTNISQAFGTQFRLPDGSLNLTSVDKIEGIEKSKRAQEIVSIVRKLEAKRLALEKRIQNAIDSVEDPNALPDAHTEEFKRIVAERKIAQKVRERVLENEKQNATQMQQWRAEAQAEADILFEKYRDRANQLGLGDIERRIDPAHPETQRWFFMFPSLSWDFFGPIHSFDWSVTTDTYGPHAGESAIGETFRSLRGSTENEVASNERKRLSARSIYLADYMYRAEQIKSYHENNPDASLTAEHALLLQLFHPEIQKDPLFLDKTAKIAPDKLERQMELSAGIRDKFKSSTERERFIRSYAYEALQTILGSPSVRIEAFKKLRGLNDVEFESFRNSRTPEQVELALRDKEVIENAMYLIRDSNGLAFVKPSSTTNPYNWKTGEVTATGKDKPMLKGNKRQPFLTGQGEHFGMPIDSLVKMDGFKAIWEQELHTESTSSMFDSGGQTYIKKKYEEMPLFYRMNLQTSTVNKLMLENRQGMAQYQKEAHERRANKPMWFPEQMDKVEHGGDFSKNADYEYARVEKLLSTTLAVESSIQKFKKQGVSAFITDRQFALHHLLSLNDGLAFSNLDWSKPESGSFRESNDGRYIIKRNGDDHYEVFFAGEKVKNADGVQVLEIPTVQMGIVENVTQAQVLVRFYEDDIKGVRIAANQVTGGQGNTPWKVGNVPMPADKTGGILKSLKYAPQFSETVLKLYEQNKGSPHYSEEMRNILSELSYNGENYGENQYVQFVRDNGSVDTDFVLITPTREGALNETHTRFINSSGHTVWELKPKAEAPEVPTDTTAGAENVQAAVNTADNKPTAPETQAVADASSWRIESRLPSKAGEVYSEWATIRNKLNYLMVRLRDEKGISVFRLFNPASGYVGQFRREQEAVDAVLREERTKR